MAKKSDSFDNYALFYEKISDKKDKRGQNQTQDTSYDKVSLSEDQLSRLSEDLRSPIPNESAKSNPLQN